MDGDMVWCRPVVNYDGGNTGTECCLIMFKDVKTRIDRSTLFVLCMTWWNRSRIMARRWIVGRGLGGEVKLKKNGTQSGKYRER